MRGGARGRRVRRTLCTLSPPPRAPTKQLPPPRFLGSSAGQAAEKGADARRRPRAAGEAYSLYVEPAAEGANEAAAPSSVPRQQRGSGGREGGRCEAAPEGGG